MTPPTLPCAVCGKALTLREQYGHGDHIVCLTHWLAPEAAPDAEPKQAPPPTLFDALRGEAESGE